MLGLYIYLYYRGKLDDDDDDDDNEWIVVRFYLILFSASITTIT